MKYIYAIVAACVSMAFPTWLTAQTSSPSESGPSYLNHAEIGAYGDYFRFAPTASTSANFLGVGGRVGFNLNPFTQIEAQMSYDFAQNFTTTSTSGSTTSTTTTFITSSVRPLIGLFGPKFQFGDRFRVFVTGKVGFIDFSTNNSGTTSASSFSGAVSGVGNAGTHLAFYPGGGIEGFFGPVGLRADAGDEIYLNNGTYNNLLVEFGPTFRF